MGGNLLAAGLIRKWSQWSELDQADARTFIQVSHTGAGASTALPDALAGNSIVSGAAKIQAYTDMNDSTAGGSLTYHRANTLSTLLFLHDSMNIC